MVFLVDNSGGQPTHWTAETCFILDGWNYYITDTIQWFKVYLSKKSGEKANWTKLSGFSGHSIAVLVSSEHILKMGHSNVSPL